MSNMDLGDWMVFATLAFTFLSLFVICVYLVFSRSTLKMRFDARGDQIMRLNILVVQQAEYIDKRDKQGWDYVEGSGSGEPQGVLEDDDRGRHHRVEPPSEATTQTIYIPGRGSSSV